jgi:chromosomal replication initiation ATPase DnaA
MTDEDDRGPARPDLAAAADQMRERLAHDDTPRERHSVLDDDVAADRAATAAMLGERRELWQRTIPRRFWDARPEHFTDPLGGEISAWSALDEPPNLVLLGAVGVGKSHAAAAAIRPRFAAGATVVFVPVGELLDSLDWRRPDSAETMERLCQVDLLVVDDLGTERSNEWTGERLYLVVNRRWLDMRPTIITSNLDPDQLTEAVGERTYSRLAHDATALRFTGEDRRRG